MLTIRKEQMKALGRIRRLGFEVRLARHARKFFPEPCREMDDEVLQAVCQRAIRRAAYHGMVAEADVARFLSLMLVFGRRFDEDPSLPWARRVLAQDVGPTLKSHRLYFAALEHEHEARGFAAEPQKGDEE